jgi:SAM-dependent methyltransferase
VHNNSLRLMQDFVINHLNPRQQLRILDVGSQDINGNYRSLFINSLGWWEYVGIDVVDGDNVNLIITDKYKWPIADQSFDVVISGQCLEHVEAPWLWVKEIERVCKVGGMVCIIAPSCWIHHRYPLDCWRIYPDGMSYLLGKWCNFEILECHLSHATPSFVEGAPCDCIGIGRKR